METQNNGNTSFPGELPPSRGSSNPSPGGHLSTPPARRVGRWLPSFSWEYRGLPRGAGVAPPCVRGESGGA